jgi:hypothetical protein
VPAQRVAHQPRRRLDRDCRHLHDTTENRHDLARRNGVGWMRWLGGTTPEGRDDLPDGMAPAGGAWDGVRGRSSVTRLGAMAVGCVPLAERPRALLAIPFPPRWRPDALPGMAPEGVPRDGASRHRMRSPRWRSDA